MLAFHTLLGSASARAHHPPPSLAGCLFYLAFGVAVLGYAVYAIATGKVIAGRFSVSRRDREPFRFWFNVLFWGICAINFSVVGLIGLILHLSHPLPPH